MIVPKHVKSIDHFRTPEYRVFLAATYFGLDLDYEIKWHQKYLKKLHEHRKKPHKFHKERGHKTIDHRKVGHHREWVVDSIPFHQRFLHDHQKRLETILSIMPKRKYRKINRLTLEHGGLPEYFVVHRKTGEYFFVANHSDHKRNYWIHLVRDKGKMCDVIVLNPEP